MALKVDDTILLNLLLAQNKMTRRDYVSQVQKKYNLKHAVLIQSDKELLNKSNPITNEPAYRNYDLYSSGKYMIKTTKYGRILDIISKPVSQVEVQVKIKKKRTIAK